MIQTFNSDLEDIVVHTKYELNTTDMRSWPYSDLSDETYICSCETFQTRLKFTLVFKTNSSTAVAMETCRVCENEACAIIPYYKYYDDMLVD